MPIVNGARVSVSRHGDSTVHKTVKGAQAQDIGKIVCGAGNEIDREASTWKTCFKFQEEGVGSKDQSPGFHENQD